MQQNKTILIVEDHEDTRSLYMSALSGEGHILEASNRAEAYAALVHDPLPDKILLDLTVPDLDPAEFVRAVRSLPSGSKVKIILVSGWDGLPERARQLGTDGFIKKPFELRKLYEAIS